MRPGCVTPRLPIIPGLICGELSARNYQRNGGVIPARIGSGNGMPGVALAKRINAMHVN